MNSIARRIRRPQISSTGSARRARAVAGATAAVVAGALLSVASAAHAADGSAAPAAQTPKVEPRTLLTVDHGGQGDNAITTPGQLDVSRARLAGTSHKRPVGAWKGERITYWETIPKRWQWGLDHAIGAWNDARIGIRFVKARIPRKAQVEIGYGETRGASGMASLGYQPGYGHAFVHLSPAYKKARPETTKYVGELGTQVWVGRVFTHELGHVLGLPHSKPRCSLMTAVYNITDCPLLDDEAGMYACQWADKYAQKVLTWAYGGPGKLAPRSCPIDPYAPKLTNVHITGGGDEPVHITWDRPGSFPAGTRIGVFANRGRCRAPGWDEWGTAVPLTATSWRSSDDHEPGRGCYDIRTLNKTGASLSSGTATLDAYVKKPATPVISNPRRTTEDGDPAWAFDATWPADILTGGWDETNPTICPAVLDEDNDDLILNYFSRDDELTFYGPDAGAGGLCVTFQSETQWGVTSAPVEVRFTS